MNHNKKPLHTMVSRPAALPNDEDRRN